MFNKYHIKKHKISHLPHWSHIMYSIWLWSHKRQSKMLLLHNKKKWFTWDWIVHLEKKTFLTMHVFVKLQTQKARTPQNVEFSMSLWNLGPQKRHPRPWRFHLSKLESVYENEDSLTFICVFQYTGSYEIHCYFFNFPHVQYWIPMVKTP